MELTMEHKKILTQVPGRTIYEGKKSGEVYHYFTDVCVCPLTNAITEIPGKGALNHRISAFLFSKLNILGVPTHFIRTVSMRESLMHATNSLPFEIMVRCCVGKNLQKRFSIQEEKILNPPVIEYFCSKEKNHLSESIILALEWIDPEELDNLYALVIKAVHFLQGIFIGAGLNLVEVILNIGCSAQESYFITGQFSPETLCVWDLEERKYFGYPEIFSEEVDPITHYKKIANRLGVHFGGLITSQIIPFPKSL